MFESFGNNAADVRIVGIGGAGSNAISFMLSKRIPNAEFIVMNSDSDALKANPCSKKVLLKRGRGEGPLIGQQSVIASKDDVVYAIFDARVIILVAGMGGNTATSALPIIAEMAKEMDVFVLCLLTMPLAFEGKKRMESARESVARLITIADNVIVFQTDRGSSLKISIAEAFERVNDAMFQGAQYISGLLVGDTSNMYDEDFRLLRHCIKSHDFLFGTCML